MGMFQQNSPLDPSCPAHSPLGKQHSGSMRATLLALGCLLLLLLARQGEGNTVKLCGRDFLRAVVFTCGGSRWKRHLPEHLQLRESENPQHSPHEDEGDNDFSPHPELRLGIQEPRDVRAQQELQNTSKASVLSKREAATLLATSCCNVGCSRREISSLC